MAIIPINNSTSEFYTVESRFTTGYDIKLPGNGIIIHRVDTNREEQAWLVAPPGVADDALRDPGNGISGGVGDANAIWAAGSQFKDTDNNTQITINSFSPNDGTASITIGIPGPSVTFYSFVPAILKP